MLKDEKPEEKSANETEEEWPVWCVGEDKNKQEDQEAVCPGKQGRRVSYRQLTPRIVDVG